nr:hypothetical protein Iba_chr02cCG12550 [Ipomoea batatas]
MADDSTLRYFSRSGALYKLALGRPEGAEHHRKLSPRPRTDYAATAPRLTPTQKAVISGCAGTAERTIRSKLSLSRRAGSRRRTCENILSLLYGLQYTVGTTLLPFLALLEGDGVAQDSELVLRGEGLGQKYGPLPQSSVCVWLGLVGATKLGARKVPGSPPWTQIQDARMTMNGAGSKFRRVLGSRLTPSSMARNARSRGLHVLKREWVDYNIKKSYMIHNTDEIRRRVVYQRVVGFAERSAADLDDSGTMRWIHTQGRCTEAEVVPGQEREIRRRICRANRKGLIPLSHEGLDSLCGRVNTTPRNVVE